MIERCVTIFLPAKNEEEGIAEVLAELPLEKLRSQGWDVEVIVVDGRSRDRTREIARANGARVLVQAGEGKGRAVRNAIAAAAGKHVIMLDADRTYPADAIPILLERLEAGADIVLGSRLRGAIEDGAMTPFNRVGNHVLSFLASVLYLRRVSDVCTGMWGLRREAVTNLPLRSTHFEIEAELFAEGVKAGLRIEEVPIQYRRRVGETKLGRLRDGFRIGMTLFAKRVRA